MNCSSMNQGVDTRGKKSFETELEVVRQIEDMI